MIGTKRARCPLFQKRCGRQSVAIADCPFDSGAAVRLRELEFLINRLIDEDYDFEAWPGIATPQDLLTHLHATSRKKTWSSPMATSATATSLSTKTSNSTSSTLAAAAKPTAGSTSPSPTATCAKKSPTPSPPASSITTKPNANFRATIDELFCSQTKSASPSFGH
jgi:cell division septation protein DedD